MAEWKHWLLWRETCALARCTQEAQHDLQGFAFHRFNLYLQKLHHAAATPAAADAWHAFESHLALGHTRTAKAWKQWLFARSETEPTLDGVQGGATLIMRDVVREHLRREHAPRWMRSVDAPIAGQRAPEHATTLSVADLLPDPADPLHTVDRNEQLALANSLYPLARDQLSLREKIALTVHHREKALYHASVLKAAGCSKSTICNALHHAMEKLAGTINGALPRECPYTRMKVASNLLDNICDHMQKILEIEHPELFRYIEED